MTENPRVLDDFQYPYDINAESALLGALILDNSQMNDVCSIIRKDHFYHTVNGLIFDAMTELYNRQSAFDVVILKNELLQKGELDKAGGVENLIFILESVPTASNALYYAKIIREKYILRRIINIGNNIVTQSTQGKTGSELILEDAQKNIFELISEKDRTELVEVKAIADNIVNQITTGAGRIAGLSTGLTMIDTLTLGLQPSQFVVVAGRPGSGKSSFALRLIEETALKAKKTVAFFTLEVTSEQVIRNLACSIARLDGMKMRSGGMTAPEKENVLNTFGIIRVAPVFIDDTSGLSVFELKNRVRKLKSQHNVELVMVDYLQLMRWEDADNREREIAYISASLKGLAKELKIPVVAMAQLSREPERRPISLRHPRPRLSDLRESGAIEQDADVVLLLYRDEMYNPDDESVRNVCEINIAKQRNGPSGETVNVAFIKKSYRFEDLDETRIGEQEREL